MALVIICGQPSSGKSTAAACLIEALRESSPSSPTIKLIDEPSLNLDRNQSYANMPAEKNLRGLLRSEVDRSVSKDCIVIVDSLNNIKGYRYELWCIARAAAIRYCLLHCDTEESTCRAWNRARLEQGLPCYNDLIFNDLVGRFEEPDKRNRWDSPLFRLELRDEERPSKNSLPIAELVTFLGGASEHPGRKSSILQPTVATQNARASETNSLYELDQATQEVISVLVQAQAQGLVGGMGKVDIGEGIPLISLYCISYQVCFSFSKLLVTRSLKKRLKFLTVNGSRHFTPNCWSTRTSSTQKNLHQTYWTDKSIWSSTSFRCFECEENVC